MSPGGPAASLVLRRARIVDLDGGGAAEPADVLVADGVITQAGGVVARPAGVPEADGDGRWLIPGLWDAHAHLGQWAAASRRADLSAATCPEEALAIVARAARRGQPVIAANMRAGTWARRGTVAELDAVCDAVPVVCINSDFHHGWLNTRALEMAGLARRDGVAEEAEWFAAYPRVAALEGPLSAGDYRAVLDGAAAKGVAGITDYEFGAPYADWAQRWGQGCDRLRIRWASYPAELDSVRAAGLVTGSPLPGPADPRLTAGPLKVFSDGSLGTRTAWCHAPYADTGGYGSPAHSPGELAALLAAGHAAGLRVATHAIGDRALEETLAAYAATGARGSVEHAQLTTPAAISALARLPLVASVQPAHLLDDWQVADRVWPGRGGDCFPLRSLRDAGVRLALGSDAPVAPLDPWLAICAAVHRAPPGEPGWQPGQAITVAQALAASVDGRRVVAGQPGDLALLDGDPLTASAAALAGMRVALTCVAGHVVHDARLLPCPAHPVPYRPGRRSAR